MASTKSMTVMSTTTSGEWKGIGAMERPRYFPRQLITPEELNLEVRYYRDMMRRHNRLMHGWGVVAGAEVCAVESSVSPDSEPYLLRVSPGYILGPYGDEIIIARERVFDVRKGTVTGCSDGMAGDDDAWCTSVAVREIPDTFYLAVRYKEIPSRQVRVQPAACGCDDTPCEYSRICDGYEFCLREDCPEMEGAVDSPEALLEALFHTYEDHPEGTGGTSKGWVTLAKVTMDPNGVVQVIDNCSCRRMAATFANVWARCETAKSDTFTIEKVETSGFYPGTDAKVIVRGSNLSDAVEVSLPAGFTITDGPAFSGDGSSMVMVIAVGAGVSQGDYKITFTKDGANTIEKTITVQPAP